MASTDSLADNTGFAEKNGATFPILADPEKTMVSAYGALMDVGLAKRWTVYIDPEGRVAKIDRSVNPRDAGADLVANLLALGVPRLTPAPERVAPTATLQPAGEIN